MQEDRHPATVYFFLYYTHKLSIQPKVKEALGYDFINQVGRFLTGFKLSVGLRVSLTFSLFKNVSFIKIYDYSPFPSLSPPI